MQRWYPDRIGGMFTKNAEAVADLALQKPSVGMAEVGFTCEGQVTGTASHLDGGKIVGGCGTIAGWSKEDGAHLTRKQMFLGIVATMLGAPSAPYLHVRGVNRLFSPLCAETPRRMKGLFGTEEPVALGAAGQWRAWINDADWYSQNSVSCETTGAFYLYDHELADPCGPGLHTKTALFIQEAAALQQDRRSQLAFEKGEALMAARIRSVDAGMLWAVAKHTHAAGLPMTERFVNGLAARAQLFGHPQRPAEIIEKPLMRSVELKRR